MLSFGICHQLKLDHAEWYSFFVFSSSFFMYNIQRFIKEKQSNSNPTNLVKWLRNHKKQQFLLTGISLMILIYSFFKIFHSGIIGFSILSFSALISLFYVYQIKKKSLRDIPYLKIHLISFIWIIAIGGFQLVNENNFELKNWLFVGSHYFYILAVTIPFDIRDIGYDSPKQKTIPQLVGVNRSKRVSILLLLIYFVLVIFCKPLLLHNLLFYVFLGITFLLIIQQKEKSPEFYCSGLIESSIFLIGISYVI